MGKLKDKEYKIYKKARELNEVERKLHSFLNSNKFQVYIDRNPTTNLIVTQIIIKKLTKNI